MPDIEEVKAAVKTAVAAEREQVRLAIIEAIEKGSKNISEADKQAILDEIAKVYEPTTDAPA